MPLLLPDDVLGGLWHVNAICRATQVIAKMMKIWLDGSQLWVDAEFIGNWQSRHRYWEKDALSSHVLVNV